MHAGTLPSHLLQSVDVQPIRGPQWIGTESLRLRQRAQASTLRRTLARCCITETERRASGARGRALHGAGEDYVGAEALDCEVWMVVRRRHPGHGSTRDAAGRDHPFRFGPRLSLKIVASPLILAAQRPAPTRLGAFTLSTAIPSRPGRLCIMKLPARRL